MKNAFWILFLILSFNSSFSQPVTVTGSVKDEAGKPLSAALISEFNTRPATATYSDSSGNFKLTVAKFAKLTVSCKGYNDTLINIIDKKEAVIILSKAKKAGGLNDATTNNTDNSLINKNLVQDAVSTQTGVNNNYVYGGGVRNYTGSLMPVFSSKEETKGSRYLFNEWTPGTVVNADNSTFNNPAYLYNYDKTEGGLLLTHDKQSAIEVDRAQIKSFTVVADPANPLTFESVPAIDNARFVQVLSSGNKYKIYKLTTTKFVKSNYHTDGIATVGNPYDEYVDENSYYLSNVKDNTIQKISLKKKALKEAFASEGDKLDKFFTENNNEQLNDAYLANLGNYLNK